MIPDKLLEYIEKPSGNVRNPVPAQWKCSIKLQNSCGDSIHLFLKRTVNGSLCFVWKGQGCVLSQASCAMMHDLCNARPVTEIRRIVDKTISFLTQLEPSTDSEILDTDLPMLHTLANRIGCRVLPWSLLKVGLCSI